MWASRPVGNALYDTDKKLTATEHLWLKTATEHTVCFPKKHQQTKT